MNQDNPSIYPLNVRITQELRRQLERLAEQRGYPDVASLCRSILTDEAGLVPLSPEDYLEIARRVAARKEVLDARRSRH